METSPFNFRSSDEQCLLGYQWQNNSRTPGACLLIIHGAIEHAMRYQDVAEYFTKKNIAVFGYDQRGHGRSGEANQSVLQFSQNPEGWKLAVLDIELALRKIREIHPDLPVFLFGHSMGALLVRQFISEHSFPIAGVILESTGPARPFSENMILFFSKIAGAFSNNSSPSPFLHRCIFGPLNNIVKHPQTRADFISRDPEAVSEYLKDFYCNGTISIEYAQQLTKGNRKANRKQVYINTPKNLPMLFLSGTADPVGKKDGKGVKKVVESYRRAGLKNVHLNLYQGMRHEIHHELGKEKVLEDISDWIMKCIY
ncbi:MAG: lysophospholipase [Cytophagales bacterium]|nr:lysophospholipase [Cytophagales bacterium]